MGLGSIRHLALSSHADLVRQTVYGPFVVTKDHLGNSPHVKALQFLKTNQSDLSVRLLRTCFCKGSVYINGRCLPAGHQSEAARLHLNDQVTISVSWEDVILQAHHYEALKVVREEKHFAIVFKETGLDGSHFEWFDVCARRKCWNGANFGNCEFLYLLPSDHSGLMILAVTASPLCLELTIGFHAVCSAEERRRKPDKQQQEISQPIALADDESLEPAFQCELSSPSNVFGELLLVNVRLALLSSVTTLEFRSREWAKQRRRIQTRVTSAISSLERELALSVVGHRSFGGNKDKGVFICWDKVELQASLPADNNETSISAYLGIPERFTKFMKREEGFFLSSKFRSIHNHEPHSSSSPRKPREDHPNQHPTVDLGQEAQIVDKDSEPTVADPVGLDLIEFYGLKFAVNRSVMIPRPASEVLVQAAKDQINSRLFHPERIACNAIDPFVICDLGTGSGNLLLSVVHQLVSLSFASDLYCDESVTGGGVSEFASDPSPKEKLPAHIAAFGLDISSKALQVARLNAKQILSKVSERVSCSFLERDMRKPDLFEGVLKPISLVICNPPYSSESELSRISRRVASLDPKEALFAHATDSFAAYRDLALVLNQQAPGTFYLQKSILILEVGHGQCEVVKEIFERERRDQNIQVGWKCFGEQLDSRGMKRCLIFRFTE